MPVAPHEPRTPDRRRHWALRYGVAAASVVIALYGTNALGETLAGVSPLFFAAVALSAWFGGLGPGLLATLLAGLASAFFLFEPVYSLRIGWDDVTRVAVLTMVASLIGVLHETSRRAHRQMLEATEQALAANRAKDRFLAVLSHELRNPLNPILTVAGVLESDARLPEDVREDLKLIRRNAELEGRLIDDLLDLNRIARGKLTLCVQPVDAHALIEDVLAMCRADAVAKGVGLEAWYAADRHHVSADPARLMQILWNLLRNALKFTPSGGRVTVTTASNSDQTLSIEVTDTGIGIDADALGRIFDAFEQADESVTRRFGGLGLGLAISRSLAQAHRGSLQARSEGKGRGATFTLRLPTIDVGGGPPHGPPSVKRDVRLADNGHDTPDSVTPLRTLLVEDHSDTARAMCRLLRSDGHSVTAVGTAAEAVRAASDGRFDLLICDLCLPDGSGVDVIRQVRRRGMRAIALSGMSSTDEWRQTRDAGFDEYLTKPASAETIEAAIRRVTADRVHGTPLRLTPGS